MNIYSGWVYTLVLDKHWPLHFLALLNQSWYVVIIKTSNMTIIVITLHCTTLHRPAFTGVWKTCQSSLVSLALISTEYCQFSLTHTRRHRQYQNFGHWWNWQWFRFILVFTLLILNHLLFQHFVNRHWLTYGNIFIALNIRIKTTARGTDHPCQQFAATVQKQFHYFLMQKLLVWLHFLLKWFPL